MREGERLVGVAFTRIWGIRTSGLLLRHWKAMVRSSVSRAVKAVTGFGVPIFREMPVCCFGWVVCGEGSGGEEWLCFCQSCCWCLG